MRDARNALDRLSVKVDDPVVIAALAIIESMDEHAECISAQIHEMNTTLKRLLPEAHTGAPRLESTGRG